MPNMNLCKDICGDSPIYGLADDGLTDSFVFQSVIRNPLIH